ncbi:MAG TPA: glycosyltransferase, partial [Acidimicrobiales bacterium]|nr:glycosyltransferase [Acidimicrobiales bacterium]
AVAERPSVSVVTMGWRNEHHAAAFVSSLARASAAAGAGGPPPEVILVVNGEEGEGAAAAANQAVVDVGLELTVVRLDTNTGFSGGANAGVRHATGEIVVVANLDLEFDERFLVALRRAAGADGAWDLLAPRVLQGPGHEDSGVSRRTSSHRLAWVSPPPSRSAPVSGGNGACLVLRRATLDRREDSVGELFDPEYHSFNEDIDLFWWAEREGLVVRYEPALVVVHVLAGSFGGDHRFRDRPIDVQRRVIANYRVTVWKNANGLGDWAGWLLGEAVYAGQAAAFGGVTGLRVYAASWPVSVRTAAAIRRRRGRLRPPRSRV